MGVFFRELGFGRLVLGSKFVWGFLGGSEGGLGWGVCLYFLKGLRRLVVEEGFLRREGVVEIWVR